MKQIAIALAILTCAGTASAQTTQKLSAGKVNEYGLIYSLPYTTLDITLEAEKTVKTPGEFYRYAKKYLGVDPITEPSTAYQLKSVIVTPRGVTNPDERYLVQFKAGSIPFMMLNDQNMPLSINTDQVTLPQTSVLPQAVAAEPTILELPVAQQAVTAEMLQSPSSAKRAELAAARIYELRENRAEILAGSAENMPADGQAMKLVLDNLAAQEEALTAMFLGTTQTSTEVTTVNVTPADTNPRKVISRLSMTEGFVDPDNLSGVPVYLDITVTERGKLPVNEKGEEKRFPKGGLAYRVPGKAQATVTCNGNRMAQESFDVAQYGVVFGLDPNIFTDKKAPAYATFNPITGAITEIGTLTE
ncbi:MAG: DUF4831 family protein [Firmicutes bacterium]|nr:DUF4831 family protein [Bacillota bacterium]MCM1401820.1 DUF4831 family protein [Bacteroides sp.]MCM1477944.1 DUF4831 family protein [Bacteroides sp.]